MSKESVFTSFDKGDLIHGLIGGGISFVLMFILTDIAEAGLQQILINFEMIGIMIFVESFEVARASFVFGTVYLTSGFFSGLYIGYNTYENLKIMLFFPSIIGTIGLTILMLFLGRIDLSVLSSLQIIFLPFLGNVIGAYLGGFTMNWSSEREETDELRI